MVQLSNLYVTMERTIAFTIWTFVGKVMSLFSHMPSRFVIAPLPKSKCLLISWLQSPSQWFWMDLRKENTSLFPLFPHLFAMKWWDQMPQFLECWVLSKLFHSPLSLLSRGPLVSLHSLPLEWYRIWGCWYFGLGSSLWFIQPSISHDALCS